MRKLFWGGAALAVLAASVVYLAASHTSRHPTSWVGRTLIAVYRVADAINPLSLGSQTASSRATRPIIPSPDVPPDADFSQEAEEPLMEQGQFKPAGFPDFNGHRLPGQIIISDGEEFGVEIGTEVTLFPRDAHDFIGPPPVEDVPPAIQVTDYIPSTMSYVEDEDDEAEHFLWEYLRDFFRIEEVILGGTEKEEQTETLFRPLGFTPYHDSHPPSCPYTGGCPYPHGYRLPVRPVPSSQEEQGIDPPACKEDPNYHQQYPGCPYTGPRSTGQPSTPAIKEVLPPAPAKKPERSEVDTMEFRRSDAKPDEFRRIPF